MWEFFNVILKSVASVMTVTEAEKLSCMTYSSVGREGYVKTCEVLK